MKMREKINFKLEEISLEEIPVLSGDNCESKKWITSGSHNVHIIF